MVIHALDAFRGTPRMAPPDFTIFFLPGIASPTILGFLINGDLMGI